MRQYYFMRIYEFYAYLNNEIRSPEITSGGDI
jgi:hypothetical protein